jgi:hypothetical protein
LPTVREGRYEVVAIAPALIRFGCVCCSLHVPVVDFEKVYE